MEKALKIRFAENCWDGTRVEALDPDIAHWSASLEHEVIAPHIEVEKVGKRDPPKTLMVSRCFKVPEGEFQTITPRSLSRDI